MSGREVVLKRIALALDRTDNNSVLSVNDQPIEVTQRISRKIRGTLPNISGDKIDALIARMESVQMSVVRLQSTVDCIAAVEWYLESQGIDGGVPGTVTLAPELMGLAWPESYAAGSATGSEKVAVTPCVAAVAETGSVVTHSGAGTPATLNFLPENHIIVVYESQVVDHVDDVFPLLRLFNELPRTVNFVTGPSRTADIEQTLEIGAHGPRHMHVLLIAGSADERDSDFA